MTNKELVATFIEAMRISDVAALKGMIADGKIARMKEYMDTYHAKTTFGL